MTQFRTVGPSTGRIPAVSNPALRRRLSAASGKSEPRRATRPTRTPQTFAAVAAWIVLPPGEAMVVSPDACTTSSIVRLPMTITSRSLVTGRPVLSCVGFGRATLEHRAGPLYGLLDGTGLEHP